jgi:hypothetical protein
MTKDDFGMIVHQVMKLDKLVTGLVQVLNGIDPDTLPDDDVMNKPAPANSTQSISQDDPPVKDVKKRPQVVITNPELRDLVNDNKAKKQEEEEAIAQAAGIVKRVAPYAVRITAVEDIENRHLMKVSDPYGFYNYLPISKDEANELEGHLLAGGELETELTEEELESIKDNWLPTPQGGIDEANGE